MRARHLPAAAMGCGFGMEAGFMQEPGSKQRTGSMQETGPIQEVEAEWEKRNGSACYGFCSGFF